MASSSSRSRSRSPPPPPRRGSFGHKLDFGGRFPVFEQTTKSDFYQRVYVMYHGTPARNVASILRNGFRNSRGTGTLLGAGIYVSKDIDKTGSYANKEGDGRGVVLKLLVYPGKVMQVTSKDDPERRDWHRSYNSAWVPPFCNFNMIPTGREETCVKSRSQIRILGVCRGFEHLSDEVKDMTFDVSGTGTSLDERERRVLHSMLVEEGILYCHVAHLESQKFLQRVTAPDGRWMAALEEFSSDLESQMWTRSWDHCLENKSDGSVLELGDDDSVVCSAYPTGDPEQKWRIDGSGKLFNKPERRTVVWTGEGSDIETKRYDPTDDRWRFVFFGDHWTLS